MPGTMRRLLSWLVDDVTMDYAALERTILSGREHVDNWIKPRTLRVHNRTIVRRMCKMSARHGRETPISEGNFEHPIIHLRRSERAIIRST